VVRSGRRAAKADVWREDDLRVIVRGVRDDDIVCLLSHTSHSIGPMYHSRSECSVTELSLYSLSGRRGVLCACALWCRVLLLLLLCRVCRKNATQELLALQKDGHVAGKTASRVCVCVMAWNLAVWNHCCSEISASDISLSVCVSLLCVLCVCVPHAWSRAF
jgi:hypothetical protein